MSAVERQPGSGDSMGDLVTRASGQISELVREEMQLGRAELTQRGRRLGRGGGLLGGAGLVGILALQALVAAGMAALALALPCGRPRWSSALYWVRWRR